MKPTSYDQADLFSQGGAFFGQDRSARPEKPRYPDVPGAKVAGPSRDAAEAVKETAGRLRKLVLKEIIGSGAATADEIADRLGRSILSVRPRVSELHRLGEIEATGERRKNESGMSASVWRVARQSIIPGIGGDG